MSNDLQDQINKILGENKPIMISEIARRLNMKELDVCKVMPEDYCVLVSKDNFNDIWQEITKWELSTVILVHKGSVFEVKTTISQGTYANGYFNLLHSDSALSGHLKVDDIEAISLSSLPFMNKESHSIQFYNIKGELLFSIYVGRKAGELLPSVRESFLNMKERYGKKSKKNLIVYSSLTGNTKKIAEAIAEIIPNNEIYSIDEAPSCKGYNFIAVGYWVDKGMPDKKAKEYIESITDSNVALFGTLGAWPDSEHGKECIIKSEAILKEKGKNNNVYGSFICQGKVDPKLVEHMSKYMENTHPMTPDRKARIKEAEKHPNEDDCLNAKGTFQNFIKSIGL